jgi:Fe2+ or Zn2+ uptake regulation protein
MHRSEQKYDMVRVLKSPVRVAVLDLVERDPDRPMDARSLAEDLAPLFPGLKVKQVAYHLTILKGAKLIPLG